MSTDLPIESWISRWSLVPTGPVLETPAARLQPVDLDGQPAMLKVSHAAEERRGALLMVWWGGQGAARVLACEGNALLLERATDPHSLHHLSRTGQGPAARALLCSVAATLHLPRPVPPPPTLVPLSRWLQSLWSLDEDNTTTETMHDSRQRRELAMAAAEARALLATPEAPVVLHGDLHHGNVLDFGHRGWLAIDPKGLWGERGYDYANLIGNPDPRAAADPTRLARRIDHTAACAGLSPARLRRWVVVYQGLSAAWALEDGEDATPALAILRAACALQEGATFGR